MIKKLEFKQLTDWLYVAKGVNCSYKIQCKDGKCVVIKSVYNSGDNEPVARATFEGAVKWCQEDFEQAVGKFLQNP